jgi:hypothetical protein
MRRNNRTIKEICDYILGSEQGILTNIQLKDPHHYTSDHLLVVGSVSSAPKQDNVCYLKARKKFPLCMDTYGPQTIKYFAENIR